MLIFRQLFDPASSTYTYLLADGESFDAVLIDPVFEQARRDIALVRELGLRLSWTLETHVHADHITGAWLLRQALGSGIALAAAAQAQGADRGLAHGDRVAFGEHYLQVRATPGHTSGCLSYVLDDDSRAFTGDALLIRGCGRTDFQQGNAHTLFASVRGQLFSLPPQCLLFPGHDYNGLTATSVAEERQFNPRLGEAVLEPDFVAYMQHLNLPHPKQIDRAVPANLRCGQPDHNLQAPAEPCWASLRLAFSGVWEIEPQALEDVLGQVPEQVQVVDVREASELQGLQNSLAMLPQARHLPLGELPTRLGELDATRPVVLVCRSGARSARAVGMLKAQGFAQVAHLAGGMLRWHQERGQPEREAAGPG